MDNHEIRMAELLSVIAENIKKLRKQKNYSQERLAELAGLHPTYVSHLETCKANPSIAILLMIAEQLGIGIDKLIMPESVYVTDETLKELQIKINTLPDSKRSAISALLKELNTLIS